ncbi:hypothetical protein Tco_0015976 [Tanacetum coccineum]
MPERGEARGNSSGGPQRYGRANRSSDLVNISTGNAQSNGTFWGHVLNDLNNRANTLRSKDMITKKWCKMNTACHKFDAIYEGISSGLPGSNEETVLEAAKAEYSATNGKQFVQNGDLLLVNLEAVLFWLAVDVFLVQWATSELC